MVRQSLENGFLPDHIFANEVAVAGFSLIRTKDRGRYGLGGGEGGFENPTEGEPGKKR
jgi:hypothetical protein